MQIAVQGQFLLKPGCGAENDFLLQLLTPLIEKQQVKLLFLTASEAEGGMLTPYGDTHLLSPPGFLPVKSWAKQWKFSQQIPGLLKKQHLPFFISNQETAGSPVPQLLTLTTPRTVNLTGKKGKVLVTTRWAAAELNTLYSIPADQVQVIPAAPSLLYQPLDWEKSYIQKAKYTSGSEFFISDAQLAQAADLLYLLKAFSVFKKWQKSSMKLVIANADSTLLPDMESYKYRNDVVLLPELATEELATITGAAYAMVYPLEADATAIPALQAMAAEVPVIIADSPASRETGEEAFLYADTAEFNSMGQLMIQIYKDEALRSRLATAGKKQVAGRDWQQSATLLLETIISLTS